jgi:hypothetical protein
MLIRLGLVEKPCYRNCYTITSASEKRWQDTIALGGENFAGNCNTGTRIDLAEKTFPGPRKTRGHDKGTFCLSS